jgi:hypothetical protein
MMAANAATLAFTDGSAEAGRDSIRRS